MIVRVGLLDKSDNYISRLANYQNVHSNEAVQFEIYLFTEEQMLRRQMGRGGRIDVLIAEEEPLQALLAYTGVVFKNINPKDFTEADFRFAQDHLRLVSICYGLLRPLDLIKPYRMEYDVKLPELGEGNMYAYWRTRQTEPLIEEVKADDNLLINLGSMDLQPSFDWKKVEQSVRVITPDFKVWKNGKAETIVIYAKMARGQMTRYIVKNRITNPDALKDFTWEGFRYREDISSENNWIFLQD